MGLFSPIFCILISDVDCLWDDLSMGDWIATQLIGDDLPGLASVRLQ